MDCIVTGNAIPIFVAGKEEAGQRPGARGVKKLDGRKTRPISRGNHAWCPRSRWTGPAAPTLDGPGQRLLCQLSRDVEERGRADSSPAAAKSQFESPSGAVSRLGQGRVPGSVDPVRGNDVTERDPSV